MFDKQTLRRKFAQLHLRMPQATRAVLGTQASAILLANAYVRFGSPSLGGTVAAIVGSISIAGAVIAMGTGKRIDLRPYLAMFEKRKDGLRAMRSAHDILFQLTGERQSKYMAKGLRTIQGTVFYNDAWHLNVQNNSPSTNARIEATGVALGKKMADSVDAMTHQIVRESLAGIFSSCTYDNDSISLETQKYILENDPHWVREKPHLFDPAAVDFAHPGLLDRLSVLRSVGLDDAEQESDLRQWLKDGGLLAVKNVDAIPELPAIA
jgi:hypothetical protein